MLKDLHKELRVKYKNEVRGLGLGCAATKCPSTDLIQEKHGKAFCYSGKVVLSIKKTTVLSKMLS
jgi:hypothetical protein